MDCVLESEEYLIRRLYSSWGMDHLLQLRTGYSKLDVSQESTYTCTLGDCSLWPFATVSFVCCIVFCFCDCLQYYHPRHTHGQAELGQLAVGSNTEFACAS